MKSAIYLLCTFFAQFSLVLTQSYQNNWYTTMEEINNIEIRLYDDLIFASYVDVFTTRSESFRNLASYIFGSNNENKNIGMTSPVIVDLVGNEKMYFIMPSDYQIDNIPLPTNKSIDLTYIPSCKKAVIQYSGFTNKKMETKKILQLKLALDNMNINYKNDFQVLVYDSPYKLFNRRNEICVTIN